MKYEDILKEQELREKRELEKKSTSGRRKKKQIETN
jgi:hypothetical protein